MHNEGEGKAKDKYAIYCVHWGCGCVSYCFHYSSYNDKKFRPAIEQHISHHPRPLHPRLPRHRPSPLPLHFLASTNTRTSLRSPHCTTALVFAQPLGNHRNRQYAICCLSGWSQRSCMGSFVTREKDGGLKICVEIVAAGLRRHLKGVALDGKHACSKIHKFKEFLDGRGGAESSASAQTNTP